MKNITSILFSIIVFILVISVTSCSRSPKSTGIEYASQMYHSAPLEPYSQTKYHPHTTLGMNALDPPKGTIARGKSDYYYPYDNTDEGALQASMELQNPVEYSKDVEKEGKRLYGIYCSHCHGKKGMGDGPVASAPNYGATPPAYNSQRVKDLSDGALYHSITNGKNVMGAHGSMLSPEERWQIIWYIKKTRGDDMPGVEMKETGETAEVDSTMEAATMEGETEQVITH